MSGTKRTWMHVKLDGNFGNQQLNLRKNSKTRVGVHNVALCDRSKNRLEDTMLNAIYS